MDIQVMPVENTTLTTETIFKKCPLCGKEWRTVDEFLQDTELQINGYQGNLYRLFMGIERKGLLLFTHNAEHCGTTLAFTAEDFKISNKK